MTLDFEATGYETLLLVNVSHFHYLPHSSHIDRLRHWFKTIQFYVHKPALLVVGTHLDLMPKKNQKEACKRFKEEVVRLGGKSTMIQGREEMDDVKFCRCCCCCCCCCC
jgi:hypothetical protein